MLEVHFKAVIMEFITTKRNGRALIYQGYNYFVNRRGQDGKIYWRCEQSKACNGAITHFEDVIFITSGNTQSSSG